MMERRERGVVSKGHPMAFQVSGEGLTITIEESPDGARLHLEGELDFTTRRILDAAVRATDASDPPVLILDLAGLRFVDSSGLQEFITIKRRTVERNQVLRTENVHERLRKIFEISGLAVFFAGLSAI